MPYRCAPIYPLRILSRKWSYLLLRALRTPRAFSGIQRELRHITNHILTRELRLLQAEGLIQADGKYQLTSAGRSLLDAVEALAGWSVRHAGAQPCPPERSCANCMHYDEAVCATRR